MSQLTQNAAICIVPFCVQVKGGHLECYINANAMVIGKTT